MRGGLRAALRLLQEAGNPAGGPTAGRASFCSTSGRNAVQETSIMPEVQLAMPAGRPTWLRPFQPQQQHLRQTQWPRQQQHRWSHQHQQTRCGSSVADNSSSSSSSSSRGAWLESRIGFGSVAGSGGAMHRAVTLSACSTTNPWAAAGSASGAAAAMTGRLPQVRWLLGKPSTRPVKINYQDHNTTKPKKIKIKTRSVLKRRIIVDENGTYWRTQAGRRHKRYNKSSRRLADLQGLVPLAKGWARKLRKLGYKRRWWYSQKA